MLESQDIQRRLLKIEAVNTDGSPRVDEDTMPGELANVVAGRVANLLDLQGPNYTTDAACASGNCRRPGCMPSFAF